MVGLKTPTDLSAKQTHARGVTTKNVNLDRGYTPGTRMKIRTWRSAIADLKGPPPGALSGALGEGAPGWVWRCDAAISRYHQKATCLFVRFSRAAKTHQNGVIFVNIEGFRQCLSKPNYGAPQWALMVRLMQKERLESPHKPLFYVTGPFVSFGSFFGKKHAI